MRKIKRLSCHWGSLSQCTLRTLESSLWHIHTSLSTGFLCFFSPPQLWGCFFKYITFLQKFVAKIFVCPLPLLIFDNFSSKPHPTAAIFPLHLYSAAIIPTSLSPPHKPQPLFLCPPCVCVSFVSFILTLCPRNSQNSSALCTFQSNVSSGFAFFKCIPHSLAFYSISPTRQILPVKATNDSSARSASLIIYLTYIYLFLHGVPESRGFISVPCHLEHCHYQPLLNGIGSTTLLQLGGKLASRGWDLNSSW